MERNPYLLRNAVQLRADMTDAERELWKLLRRKNMNYRFLKQHLIDDKYIVDFFCAAKKLVIEVDGGQHCNNIEDKKRDAYLNKRGYTVLRFWNNELLTNMEGCLTVIKNKLS